MSERKGLLSAAMDNAEQKEGARGRAPGLDSNADLHFEKRANNPGIFPVVDNRDGSISTHRMAYAGVDGGFIAYPTIIQTPSGELVQLDDQEAFEHAARTRQFRRFSSEEDAAAYSSGGYKQSWKSPSAGY